MEIAFEEHVAGVDPKDLAFICAAVNEQMRSHFAPKWVEDSWPVKAYDDVSKLPVGTFWPIAILPQLNVSGAEGYHDFASGLAYGRVRWNGFDATSVTSSHESLELRMDTNCDQWVDIGNGKAVALELCDPCENDTYDIDITLFGETRKVPVSDFLLPSYFVKGAPRPYTFLDTIDSTAHELGLSRNGGGYLLVRDADGSVVDYWGRKAMGLARKRAPGGWQKKSDPYSRVARRMGGRVTRFMNFAHKISAQPDSR